jgi:RHS repeat-associated protein
MAMLKILSLSDMFPDSSHEQSHAKKITYTYDSMNRRVARTDENGTTKYLYGNPNHPFQLTAVRSPSGSLSLYYYDDFGLLFALKRDNNWYYISTDQLGTPQVICDVNGELVKVLKYNSFGQVLADSNSQFELHISFAGGLIDIETELVRFGFRDYDPLPGKWTAKDPIGFASGDGNLYGYVINNPVNLFDPLGLSGVSGVSGPGEIYPNNQNKKCPSQVEKISEIQKNRPLGHPYDQLDQNAKRLITEKEYLEILKKGNGKINFGFFTRGVEIFHMGVELIDIYIDANKAGRTFQEQWNFEQKEFERSNPKFFTLPFIPLPIPNLNYKDMTEI